MNKRDKYRIIIIISFILLIICSAILLAALWNTLTLNPVAQVGNGVYFLVLLIMMLATSIFVLHLMEERSIFLSADPVSDSGEEKRKAAAEKLTDLPSAPLNIDIDLLAEDIIPKIDMKESLKDYAERILLNLARHFEVVQGIIFLKNIKTQEFESLCTFAYTSDKDPPSFKIGDGIPGQVAKDKTLMNLKSIPDGYMRIESGLGQASPRNLLIIPLLLNKDTIGIIELASFHSLDKETEWTFRNLAKIIANALLTKIKSGQK